MGLYDRDYGRQRTPWDRIENPRSITITLIVINVAVWFVTILATPSSGAQVGGLVDSFCVHGNTLIRPWLWWQLLTYGFLHSLDGPMHLAFNMLGLFIFGRPLEQKLGRMEFARFYLVAVVLGGVLGSLTYLIMGIPEASALGASGAVIAVTVLFACYFPNEKIYLFFILAMPAWVLAAVFSAYNLLGAIDMFAGLRLFNQQTAFTIHLAGIAFGGAYYYYRWNLGFLAPGGLGDLRSRLRNRARRAKLKIHDPDAKLEKTANDADRILEKIHQHGESSLTPRERKTLEQYSRQQRARRGKD